MTGAAFGTGLKFRTCNNPVRLVIGWRALLSREINLKITGSMKTS